MRLSVSQAARQLGVSSKAIHDAIRRGRLPCVKEQIAGYTLLWISPADLEAYAASRTMHPGRPKGSKNRRALPTQENA